MTTNTATKTAPVEPSVQDLFDALPDRDKRAMDSITKSIANPPENSRVFTFTPGMARLLIRKYNLANRPMKPGKIKQYAEDMSNDRWGLTGDTIKFSTVGRLRDGQNRLFACMESDASFRTHVVFGIEDDLFAFMDRGKNRDGSDLLAIKGITNSKIAAAATRWAELFERGTVKSRRTFLPNEILDLYEGRHSGVSNFILEAKATAQPAGMMAALLYTFDKIDPQAAAAFGAAWAGGQRHKPFQAIAKAEARIQEIFNASSGRVHDVVRAACIVIAWNFYRDGGKAGLAKNFQWDVNTMAFPVIR